MAAHYMTPSEYEAFCVENVDRWARLYAGAVERDLMSLSGWYAEKLSEAEYQLAKCGWDWEAIEEIEIAAYKAA